MNLVDTIKKSLGFEITEESRQQYRSNPGYSSPNRGPRQNPNFNNNARTSPRPDFDDVEPIIPEQPYYEIVLIRPRTIDDINYVVDQVLEENNPVILDLSFLERESAANFKLAGDKINQMRSRYGVQALLLAKTDDKELIIVSPKKVRVINKG